MWNFRTTNRFFGMLRIHKNRKKTFTLFFVEANNHLSILIALDYFYQGSVLNGGQMDSAVVPINLF